MDNDQLTILCRKLYDIAGDFYEAAREECRSGSGSPDTVHYLVSEGRRLGMLGHRMERRLKS